MPATLIQRAAARVKPHADDETLAFQAFRRANVELFEKNDFRLLLHVGTVLALMILGTYAIVTTPHLWLKLILGPVNAFFWFSLGNVTVHHHHTHHNAAKSEFCRRLLNALHFVVVPDGGRHLTRYRRAHMNHHSRPLEDTDVDHRYALAYHKRMSKNLWTKMIYYLELTFVGGHVPGRRDERYLNRTPPADWNLADYEKVKQIEVQKAKRNCLIEWAIVLVALVLLPGLGWGLLFPLILVKNWTGFLGQFQHYDEHLLDPVRTKNNRTKTFRIPSFLNWLAGGEISGHFLHHIYPDMPYYNVERARRRLMRQPELVRLVVNY